MINCKMCGEFIVTEDAWDYCLDPLNGAGHKLSEICRIRLAHKLRTSQPTEGELPVSVTRKIVNEFIESGCPGPTPAEQAKNIIQFVGDKINQTGDKLKALPENFFTLIGAPNPWIAGELVIELYNRGILSGIERKAMGIPPSLLSINLTLNGWEEYQEVKRGDFSGNYGFIAMKFGDDVLDKLVKDVIKPSIYEKIGYNLLDMRDVAQAGIIDNIMRAQIRDSAFILVDLTHDNSGAYWEAGYAEGLGKPVVYICEANKFDNVKTHFDTNHCTTVLWSSGPPEIFIAELIATIRRSLNLFD
ncbi:MAG: hypothetical protein WD075_04660 [Rhodospirillales bacterium]